MDTIILKSFLPEFFLSMSILFQLVYNIKLINVFKYNFPIIDKEVFYQTIFILISLFFIYSNLKIEGFFSNFLFVNDESTRVVKMILIITCLFSLHIILHAFSLQSLNFFEYFIIFLLALLSLLLLISSYDLISFYLVIEMQSLCFYILASFKRDSAFSTEAGLKYFIAGAFISGVFLFGSSLIYGCLGTLNFNALHLLLAIPFESFSLLCLVFFGALFVTITLLFKIACAPFHFWAPDVYEGSPLSSTIIFSIIPKISLVYFFIKWMFAINMLSDHMASILIWCALLSTFVGTFQALSQKRLKRLIIFSSIAQVGFIVAGLSANTIDAYTNVIFFLLIYIITSILIWAHFSLFYGFQAKINEFSNQISTSLYISSLTNLYRTNKIWSFSFVIIFFSIGGIPPLTGFLSKIYILFDVLQNVNIIVGVFLIIISAVSVYYYIRMIKIMFFEPKSIESNYEKFQVTFHDSFLDTIYLIIPMLLSLLVIFFFCPTMPLLLCEYIVLNMSCV